MAHAYYPLDACGVPYVAMQTPEEHARLARERIAAREWRFAAHHLAGTLAPAGGTADTDAIAVEMLAAAGGVDALLPSFENASHAVVAARAKVLAAAGRWADAIKYALEAAAARPDLPYLAWIDAWLDAAPPGALVGSDLNRYAGHTVLSHDAGDPAGRAALEAAAPRIERMCRLAPDDVDLAYWAIALVRKLGRYDEALLGARALYARVPNARTALAVAMVHRMSGAIDDAIAMYRRAIQHDPRDVGCRLDAADLLSDRGELDLAIRTYEEVLAFSPGHEWAEPSAHFFKWRKTGDASHAHALVAYAKKNGKSRRATDLVSRLPAELRPAVKERRAR